MADESLNAGDRCDGCSNSRAYVSVVLRESERLPFGGRLLLCRHHWNQHGRALAPYVASLVDETARINAHIADDKHLV